jgi:hypothetical protein
METLARNAISIVIDRIPRCSPKVEKLLSSCNAQRLDPLLFTQAAAPSSQRTRGRWRKIPGHQ